MNEDTRTEAEGVMERAYAIGLERVAKVIEAAADYDAILGPGRLGKPQYGEIVAKYAGGDVATAASTMAKLIRTSRLSLPQIPVSARILSFAKTHNNRLQLDYFDRKTRPWRTTGIVELSTCEVDRTVKVEDHFSKLLESELCTFLLRRKVLSRSLIHQLVGYSVSYCAMVLSLSATRVRGLIVANDHSPMPVAISMAAKAVGITRVYLQHAQVTTSFPPLDFEYSILMNRRSERIYEAVTGTPKQAAGEVVVLRREGNTPVLDEILERTKSLADSQEVTVGLYPSAIFEQQRLVALVSALQANRDVTNVFLKPHPSLDMGALAESLGVKLCAMVPEEPHVAIVGNSSVAQGLATAGHLVFQDFKLDPVVRDYYGFVNDGLTCELGVQDIGERFWQGRGSCELLKAALAQYLNDEASGLDEAGELHFFKKVAIDLGGGLRSSMTSVEELDNFLKLFPRSLLASLRNQELLGLDALSTISTLDVLFNERTIDLNTLYPLVDPSDCRSIVDFWLVAKLVQWNGTAISNQELVACRGFISRYKGKFKVKRWMETKYFDMLMQLGRHDLLAEFLSSAEYFTVKTAHLNKKIAFLNICSRTEEAEFGLSNYYDYDSDTIGEFERLKIEVQCRIREGDRLLFDDYRKVESRFMEVAPPSVAKEYADVVLSTFEQIRGRDRLIDVKRSREQQSALVTMAVDRLRTRQGFSAVRLSDGEGYLFRASSDFFTDSDARNRERHWWGEELDDRLRGLVVAHGLETVANADVIGIPSIYRFLRDCSPKSTSLLSSIQGRGLASVLRGVLHHASDTTIFSDDKFNIAVFNQRPYLEEIASHAMRTTVVTGARADVVKDALSYLGDVEVINVPTHNKTSSNERFYTADKPLPYMLSEIREEVEAKSSPGTLVLVGAGIAGKSFVHAAKAAGGVGLDLGSALDELVDAGIHSLH